MYVYVCACMHVFACPICFSFMTTVVMQHQGIRIETINVNYVAFCAPGFLFFFYLLDWSSEDSDSDGEVTVTLNYDRSNWTDRPSTRNSITELEGVHLKYKRTIQTLIICVQFVFEVSCLYMLY